MASNEGPAPSNPVIVEKYTTIYPRVNVLDFQHLPQYQKHRDLLVIGFIDFTNQGGTDPRGFFQVGGIHGLPYIPYDGVTGRWTPDSGAWGGYCWHGSVLFPSWHRPYVLLAENLIRKYAKAHVDGIQNKDDKAAYAKAWEELRIPYLDWGHAELSVSGLPTILTDAQLTIHLDPQSNSVNAAGVQVANPFVQFNTPRDVGDVQNPGNANPMQKPHYEPNGSTVYFPKGYQTVRYPDANNTTQVDQLNTSVKKYNDAILRPALHQLWGVSDFVPFSNHFTIPNAPGEDNSQYGYFCSLEVIHDAVHDAVGGNGGHMSYPDFAGFDPIFYFHHANVDRLFAMWQYCYPDSWIPANGYYEESGTFTVRVGQTITETTPLTPFRSSKTEFWTAKKTRNIEALGYTYPDIAEAKKKGTKPADFIKYLRSIYDGLPSYQLKWYVSIWGIKKQALNGPFQIRVFLNKPDADAHTPITDPHFAGQIFVFARPFKTLCAKCQLDPNIRGSVSLTAAMVRLNVDVYPESSSIPPDPTDPGLESHAQLIYQNLKLVIVQGNKTVTSVIGKSEPNPGAKSAESALLRFRAEAGLPEIQYKVNWELDHEAGVVSRHMIQGEAKASSTFKRFLPKLDALRVARAQAASTEGEKSSKRPRN